MKYFGWNARGVEMAFELGQILEDEVQQSFATENVSRKAAKLGKNLVR